jgi:hypothetical protein
VEADHPQQQPGAAEQHRAAHQQHPHGGGAVLLPEAAAAGRPAASCSRCVSPWPQPPRCCCLRAAKRQPTAHPLHSAWPTCRPVTRALRPQRTASLPATGGWMSTTVPQSCRCSGAPATTPRSIAAAGSWRPHTQRPTAQPTSPRSSRPRCAVLQCLTLPGCCAATAVVLRLFRHLQQL